MLGLELLAADQDTVDVGRRIRLDALVGRFLEQVWSGNSYKDKCPREKVSLGFFSLVFRTVTFSWIEYCLILTCGSELSDVAQRRNSELVVTLFQKTSVHFCNLPNEGFERRSSQLSGERASF